jgi:hypothetical protein
MLALLFLSIIIPTPIYAQSDALPEEVMALFNDITDIDKMRVLNPLKLRVDQLDKLISTIRASQESFNRRLDAAAVPPIRAIAKEIRETRQKLLKGGEIPKDFDEKVRKLHADFLKKRKAEEENTLKSLAAAIRSILTEQQVQQAVSIARKWTEEDGQPTKRGTNEQFFNLYVLGTFITYPRIVPLLEDIRKAMSDTAQVPPNPLQEARQ